MRPILVKFKRSQLTLEKQASKIIRLAYPTFCQGDYRSTLTLAIRTGFVCPL